MGVKFLDFNNDGQSDLYVTDMHSDMLYEQGYAGEKRKSQAPFSLRRLFKKISAVMLSIEEPPPPR